MWIPPHSFLLPSAGSPQPSKRTYFLQRCTPPVSPYFLEAFQGALHVFITSEHVRERALHGVEVCQSGFLLHGDGVQGLLRAQGVSLLVLWEDQGRTRHRGMTKDSLVTLYKLEAVCAELLTSWFKRFGRFDLWTLTNHLSDGLLIFCNNLPAMRQKHMIRLT